eukprot:symbB.v1.2.009384.t1/scaffold595.1/size183375/6
MGKKGKDAPPETVEDPPEEEEREVAPELPSEAASSILKELDWEVCMMPALGQRYFYSKSRRQARVQPPYHSILGLQEASTPLNELLCTEDFEEAAKNCLPEASWDYISGGEADTIQRNRSVFDPWLFRPRILRDVSNIDLSCELFGASCETPIYLSSLAKGKLVDPQGEATFMRAAERLKSRFLVPTISSVPLEEVWKATKRPPAFQVYILSDGSSRGPLDLALRLGVGGVVITVDANAPRHGALHRATAQSTGVFPSHSFNWEELKELRKTFPADVPVYLKGIQSAEDALQAVAVGVRGIVVSNHGGRACGNAIGALEALEEVAEALRSAGLLGPESPFELYYDSGVRNGRDVVKALCLGAWGVGIGRPYYWAAACHGEEGIIRLVEQLNAELRLTMAQLGVAQVKDLTTRCLARDRSSKL